MRRLRTLFVPEWRWLMAIALPLASVLLCGGGLAAAASIPLQTDDYQTDCDIQITQEQSLVHVRWSIGPDRDARMSFDLSGESALIAEIAVADSDDAFRRVATQLDPLFDLRVGDRDLERRSGWTIFFDRMQRKASEVSHATLEIEDAAAASHGRRATVTLGKLIAGPFSGRLRWTFFADNPFVLLEAQLATQRPRTAYLYDAGLVCRGQLPRKITYRESSGLLNSDSIDSTAAARNLAVRGRTVAAQFDAGAVAVFPPPHRYFYPLDFSNNLKNLWIGPKRNVGAFGFGIRHDPQGDNRFVPWFNAPPGTTQEMGLFLWISGDSAKQTLQQVSELTRGDRFEPLDGHQVFTSHYHVEHAEDLLNSQSEAEVAEVAGVRADGTPYRIPQRLVTPGFVRSFRDLGIDIVHLAEFHFGRTPKMTRDERLERLQLLHAECERLSDEGFLLLPGEEPNVHLGGHWISFFPKPVHWVLNRPEGTPFVTEDSKLGRVYHVGSAADVFRLLREERGLAWTAHARIKGSTGYPDRYRQELFFQSDRFLGAAWKAMPADLSRPRLGWRVLDLLDDMSNWGDPKYSLGEVDVFKIEPDHELYAHMNVNYLRLDEVPRFDDGWHSILETLRAGHFFVTTGEVLIPEFAVAGAGSGDLAKIQDPASVKVNLSLKWTFPLSHAEIVTGDGSDVSRQRIDLSQTDSFDERDFQFNVDVSGKRWLRVEVWDVATNGAFTQPVWMER